jgi:hypothetical protein
MIGMRLAIQATGTEEFNRDGNKRNLSEETTLMRTGIQVWHAHQREEQFNYYRNARSNSSMTGSATGRAIQARQARELSDVLLLEVWELIDMLPLEAWELSYKW